MKLYKLIMLKLQETIFNFPEINLFFDFSKSAFNLSFIKDNALIIENSLREMAALESGAIANPSEQRMVGHYWLRDGSLAPIPEIRSEIASLYEDIAQFAQSVISGKIKSPAGTKFKKILLIGIGALHWVLSLWQELLRGRRLLKSSSLTIQIQQALNLL
jgi:glucose-6-phosphate isomerase